MADEWMRISVEIPADEGRALLLVLREKLGFKDVDWCVMMRPDFAKVDYDPCPPRTESGYTIDPFSQTGDAQPPASPPPAEPRP